MESIAVTEEHNLSRTQTHCIGNIFSMCIAFCEVCTSLPLDPA
jgi:hypothetical protein